MGWYDYKPYVSVAQRRAQAAREVTKRRKAGQRLSPVEVEGREIALTFWGRGWCTHLESYSDYANRLGRGRSYVRNGSVIDLKIGKGRIDAIVSGSDLYEIRIDIAPLPAAHWRTLKARCAGQIGSLVELLQGKLSKAVMERVTDRTQGLFPKPSEIAMRCNCPDYAGMCKHLAAVLYGVGNRLDLSPELLFLLRGVDHGELLAQAIPSATPSQGTRGTPTIASGDLDDIFGIEVEGTLDGKSRAATPKKSVAKAAPIAPRERSSKKPSTASTRKTSVVKSAKKATPNATPQPSTASTRKTTVVKSSGNVPTKASTVSTHKTPVVKSTGKETTKSLTPSTLKTPVVKSAAKVTPNPSTASRRKTTVVKVSGKATPAARRGSAKRKAGSGAARDLG